MNVVREPAWSVKKYYFEEEPQVEIPLTVTPGACGTTCSRPSPWPRPTSS